MKKYIHLAAMLLLVGMCAAPLWAQLDGSIKGTAKDQNGNPIAGATVQIYDATSGRKYSSKTNAKGEYVFGTVYAGTYKATLIQNGNPIDEQDNIPIAAGQEQTVNFGSAKSGAVNEQQKANAAATSKTNEKIKGLNATLKQAKDLESAGNYDQAVTLLQQTAQAAPDQDLLWAYLGDAQRGAGSKATDAQAKAKDYQDAVASYQKALAIKPTDGSYMAQLADAYIKSGDFDKGIQQYSAAAQADPTNAGKYYYNEGAELTNKGKSDEAIAALDKAIAADPNRAVAYYLKGQNLIAKSTTKGDKLVAPDGTAECFNKYLELEPNGKFADMSKQMLAMIGASVQTTYGKSKAKK